jgi:hypothetical protein
MGAKPATQVDGTRAGNRQILTSSPLNILQQCFSDVPGSDLSRQFVVETQARAIDASNDVAELRRIAKTLLKVWHLQTNMTRHFGAQALGITPPSP